jgi:hypothetical protein
MKYVLCLRVTTLVPKLVPACHQIPKAYRQQHDEGYGDSEDYRPIEVHGQLVCSSRRSNCV